MAGAGIAQLAHFQISAEVKRGGKDPGAAMFERAAQYAVCLGEEGDQVSSKKF